MSRAVQRRGAVREQGAGGRSWQDLPAGPILFIALLGSQVAGGSDNPGVWVALVALAYLAGQEHAWRVADRFLHRR